MAKMPQAKANEHSAAPRRQRRAPSHEQAKPAYSPDLAESHHSAEALQGESFGHAAFERHVALLSDSRLSHPMHARQRALIVRQLQRDYGNRYVQRLVDRVVQRRADGTYMKLPMQSPSGIVQRDVSVAHFQSEEASKALTPFFQAANDAVKNAYWHVVNAPQLGPLATLDGHTQNWVKTWNNYIAHKRTPLMSADFGYAVESLATSDLSPYRPKSPSGMSIALQVSHGGTRPDIVLMQGPAEVAWLDITADASAEHIYLKEGWNKKINNYGEVTYPSLDAATLSMMLANKDVTTYGSLSAEEFELRKQQAQKLYEARKAHWLELGKKFSAARAEAKVSREVAQLNPSILQNFIAQKIADYFKPTISDKAAFLKLAPSILAAMGVDPALFGFTTGFPASVKTGEVFLIDHDPELPAIEGKKEEAVTETVEVEMGDAE